MSAATLRPPLLYIESAAIRYPSPLWGEGRVKGIHEAPRESSRTLRRNQTVAEQTLWARLRDRRLGGAKFRRQHPIGPFIADFWCPSFGLSVEVGGGPHAEHRQADARRTAFLEGRGVRVRRFRDNEVLANIDAVLQRIVEALKDPHPGPLPGRERGSAR